MMSETEGFLGDEKFVEEIEERVEGDREIALPVPRASEAVQIATTGRLPGQNSGVGPS